MVTNSSIGNNDNIKCHRYKANDSRSKDATKSRSENISKNKSNINKNHSVLLTIVVRVLARVEVVIIALLPLNAMIILKSNSIESNDHSVRPMK